VCQEGPVSNPRSAGFALSMLPTSGRNEMTVPGERRLGRRCWAPTVTSDANIRADAASCVAEGGDAGRGRTIGTGSSGSCGQPKQHGKDEDDYAREN